MIRHIHHYIRGLSLTSHWSTNSCANGVFSHINWWSDVTLSIRTTSNLSQVYRCDIRTSVNEHWYPVIILRTLIKTLCISDLLLLFSPHTDLIHGLISNATFTYHLCSSEFQWWSGVQSLYHIFLPLLFHTRYILSDRHIDLGNVSFNK